MPNIKLKVTDPHKKIVDSILIAMGSHVNSAIFVATPHIKKSVKDLVRTAIVTSPTYLSLANGILRSDLGVVDSITDMNNIIDIWMSEVEVEVKLFVVHGNRFTGGLKVNIIDASFQNVLNVSSSFYQSNLHRIEWLKWLLTSGSASIIRDYMVSYEISPFSRTGGAIMRGSSGSNFSINPAFAGTPTDNFVTKAMHGIKDNIADIIHKEIVSRI